MFSLLIFRFREMEAFTAPSPSVLSPRGGGFYSSAIVGFCFWEAVASSAPLSSALVSGKRWLLQHRYRRLLSPGGGSSFSTAISGLVSLCSHGSFSVFLDL
ncbi:unnamed protein product [Eruca vesicaria subsp. sativa]|uniref:Uncharacterized protein n=1 Tax=Eruca vesicaria subsp. sativa TaxID=29727 RepID=A0ABC8JB49_ERUVS|nr:unnamed protein product [Eruca vesicaria subsp. sativa]